MGHYKIDDRIHAIPNTTLSWAGKCFYGRLAFRCNHKNLSWWSKKKLAKDFQTTTRSIQRWWKHLEKLGLITIHREEGSRNEISINELTDELLASLGVTELSPGGRHECLGRGDSGVSPIIKGKGKTKSKTGGRATLASVWGDSDVEASSKRAVESNKNRRRDIVLSPDHPDVVSPEEEVLPEETRLSRWSGKAWTKEFVAVMNKRGYEVAYARYQASVNHVTAIRDHLRNVGFSYRKIYRFLLMWFPGSYESICEAEFKQDPDDFMFSVAWMEPRLSRLVAMFEEDESAPKRTSKKRKARLEED